MWKRIKFHNQNSFANWFYTSRFIININRVKLTLCLYAFYENLAGNELTHKSLWDKHTKLFSLINSWDGYFSFKNQPKQSTNTEITVHDDYFLLVFVFALFYLFIVTSIFRTDIVMSVLSANKFSAFFGSVL